MVLIMAAGGRSSRPPPSKISAKGGSVGLDVRSNPIDTLSTEGKRCESRSIRARDGRESACAKRLDGAVVGTTTQPLARRLIRCNLGAPTERRVLPLLESLQANELQTAGRRSAHRSCRFCTYGEILHEPAQDLLGFASDRRCPSSRASAAPAQRFPTLSEPSSRSCADAPAIAAGSRSPLTAQALPRAAHRKARPAELGSAGPKRKRDVSERAIARVAWNVAGTDAAWTRMPGTPSSSRPRDAGSASPSSGERRADRSRR
jgi:hypothetical protein